MLADFSQHAKRRGSAGSGAAPLLLAMQRAPVFVSISLSARGANARRPHILALKYGDTVQYPRTDGQQRSKGFAMESIHRGPQNFEALLTAAALSEREKQAVRSVALSLTAEEASHLMGVSPSTVGSYRQRAYAKIGVATKAEFLELPETISWRRRQAESPDVAPPGQNEKTTRSEQLVQDDRDGADSSCPPSPQATPSKSDNCYKTEDTTNNGSRRRRRAIASIACIVLVFGLVPAIKAYHSPHYQLNPNGTLASQYGEVPNVVGMRVDAAASVIAESGFCPEFQVSPGNGSPGIVTSIGVIGDISELDGKISQFNWHGGTTAGYNEKGSWKGYVTLLVSV